MNIYARSFRRNVVLDIETVGLVQDDPRAALSALTGRIACICLLLDDGRDISESAFIDRDEKTIVSAFWNAIRPTDVFLGHNLIDFDLPFIRQRSWILGVRPSRRVDLRRYYSKDLIDTMQIWANWGSQRYAGLDQLAAALGCDRKIAHGNDVTDWWSAGDFLRIAEYCMHDVRVSYQVFRRMMFQSLPQRYVRLKPVAESIRDNIIPFPTERVEAEDGRDHNP
jgi:predicted PolB exonuclease-like 3'-5' exonuclease